ncbi:MAG: endonuclease [Chloroflexi bacterium]|nr:endonuclease [Chloroflexota bacterium]
MCKLTKWTVYILLCKDSSFYTGITNDLTRRLLQHENGAGAKYTRGRGPFTVIYKALYNNQGDALKEERRIKQLSKSSKIKLTNNYLADKNEKF